MTSSAAASGKLKTAVILIAHGAPLRIQDIPKYLKNIRGGKDSSPEVIQEVASRYKQIGGRSPLLDITTAQADALEQYLNQAGDAFKGLKVVEITETGVVFEENRRGSVREVEVDLMEQWDG